MKKDLYAILGVSREADEKEIKRAYRRAAKRFHPDVSPKDEERFKELQEAYETLSDRAKRQDYDRETSSVWRDAPLFDEPVGWRGPDGFFARIADFFRESSFPWGGPSFRERERTGPVRLEIVLTQTEAKTGGSLPVEIPLQVRCSRCHGTGTARGLICGRCRGDGREKQTAKATINVPPGIRDRAERRVRFGVQDGGGVDVVVTFRVMG